jgi:glycerophosphoryl diester phosphodiesterase
MAVGAVLVLWSGVNFVVTLLTATTFSVLLVNLYRKLGSRGSTELPRLVAEDSPRPRGALRLTRRTVLVAGTAAVVLAALTGIATVRSVRLEDHSEITAHRGASGAAPENTLAAVERAIADGADWVEIDVQESADGVVLVVHDSDLKKLAGVNLKIWETTAEELRKVDIGSRFAPEFAGERVPTLDEVLQTCKGRVRVNIELKYYGHDKRLEERVVERVEAHQMQSDVVIMSLKYDAIRKVRSLRPTWKIGLLSAVTVGDLTKLDADFLAVSIGLATRSFIRSAHNSGKEVYVWTVNDPVTMSTVIGHGVDNVITDEPAMARSVLEQRAVMSPVERLLVELAVLFGGRPKTNLTADDI